MPLMICQMMKRALNNGSEGKSQRWEGTLSVRLLDLVISCDFTTMGLQATKDGTLLQMEAMEMENSFKEQLT